MIYPDLDQQIPAELGRVHFVGIGGSGMQGIARMMHERGVQVSGSDLHRSASTAALEELGIKVSQGHAAQNVEGADTLVVTGALRQDNPEYQYALQHNLQVLHRSQALHWLTRGQRLVAVAGAHGKTTSTGMVVEGLLAAKASPSFVNGGIIEQLGVSASNGADETFVIEADESDRSFLLYDPAIALITNVDPEHLDFYGSRENFMQAFVDFASGVSECVVASADDSGVQEVLAELPAGVRVRTFGENAEAHLRIADIDTSGPVKFSLTHGSESVDVQLAVYGKHNAHNAAGAIAVLLQLGYSLAEAAAGVATFGGTKRRFEFHGQVGGVRVYDDFAHHPTEVAALLSSIRPVVGEGRLIAVHQPHLFSRTQHFHREFAEVLEKFADFTVVLPIDGAREEPVPGVTGALVSDDFVDQSKTRYFDDWESAAAFIGEFATPGDLFVTMSGGNVYNFVPQILDALSARFGTAGAEFAPGYE